jgi:hypothetical protein
MKSRFILAVLFVCLLDGAAAQNSPLVGILQSELQRNMEVLGRQPVAAYYGAYTVHDTRTAQIVATFGAVERSDESRQRFATVEVRVGDYLLDNTHPMRGDTRAMPPRLMQVGLPLSEDEKPIRQALAPADRSYKQAKGAHQGSHECGGGCRTKSAPDFSREEPSSTRRRADYARHQSVGGEAAARVRAVRRGSAMLRSGVADGRADCYVNSEGSQIVTGDVGSRIFIQGVTKAEDGMELPLYTSYYAATPDGLPDERRLLAEARSMIDLLAQLRKAPVVEPFSGPAILAGRAAGVFFHEIFGHRVEGNRQRNADDGQTFTKQVGQPVLPPFLSVLFDPTLKKVGTTELMGISL